MEEPSSHCSLMRLRTRTLILTKIHTLITRLKTKWRETSRRKTSTKTRTPSWRTKAVQKTRLSSLPPSRTVLDTGKVWPGARLLINIHSKGKPLAIPPHQPKEDSTCLKAVCKRATARKREGSYPPQSNSSKLLLKPTRTLPRIT